MRRVDLPTPGSPPIRTRLPGTMPPPSTRLSSPQARRVLGACSASISTSGVARAACSGRAFEAPAAFLIWNYCSVFQARQWGHWPDQRRLSPPHSVQTKVMFDLGIARLCTNDRGFDKAARTLLQPRAFYLMSVKTPL